LCVVFTYARGSVDNSPDVPNKRQADNNGNHIGNACETTGEFKLMVMPRGARAAPARLFEPNHWHCMLSL
jgi:hypothetical protein